MSIHTPGATPAQQASASNATEPDAALSNLESSVPEQSAPDPASPPGASVNLRRPARTPGHVYGGMIPGNGESQEELERIITHLDAQIDEQRAILEATRSRKVQQEVQERLDELCARRYFHFYGKLSTISRETVQQYAEDYLAYLDEGPPDKDYVTDDEYRIWRTATANEVTTALGTKVEALSYSPSFIRRCCELWPSTKPDGNDVSIEERLKQLRDKLSSDPHIGTITSMPGEFGIKSWTQRLNDAILEKIAKL